MPTYVDKLLVIDTIAIDARLTSVLQDRNRRKTIFDRRGREAQNLLNLLQAVIYYTRRNVS